MGCIKKAERIKKKKKHLAFDFNLFSEYTLSAYCVPGTVIDFGDNRTLRQENGL